VNIGIHSFWIDDKPAGIGTYTGNLVKNFIRMGKGEQLFLIHEKDSENEVYKKTNNVINPFLSPRQLQCLGIPYALKKYQIGLFHSVQPFYQDFLPFYVNTGVKKVLTIHDLSTLLFPETHTALSVRLINFIIKTTKGRSDRIITDSENSRRDLVKYLHIPDDKISVIHNAAGEQFRPITLRDSEKQRLEQKYGIPGPFLLFVGTLEPRKNIPGLLKAYRRVRSRGIPHKLVIAGNKGWKYQEIFALVESLNLRNDVIFTGYVPDPDLVLLYNLADVFLYPSLYEGFGLPPLEAMACGTPVISSDVSSIPEVVGKAGILVDPTSTDRIADAIETLVRDENYRRELRHSGLIQAKRFSWERTARQTWSVYEEILEG
jgi:glycosyltransferase involved in cell wall biosynthesis